MRCGKSLFFFRLLFAAIFSDLTQSMRIFHTGMDVFGSFLLPFISFVWIFPQFFVFEPLFVQWIAAQLELESAAVMIKAMMATKHPCTWTNADQGERKREKVDILYQFITDRLIDTRVYGCVCLLCPSSPRVRANRAVCAALCKTKEKPFSGYIMSAVHRAKHLVVYFSMLDKREAMYEARWGYLLFFLKWYRHHRIIAST